MKDRRARGGLGTALVLAGGLAIAPPARAEPVLVLGGEHEGFTRLVFYFDAPPDWSLTAAEGTVRLDVEDEDVSFELGRAFGRIGRSRIRSIETGAETSAEVEIALGCDCGVEAFELGRLLVLDVTDDARPPLPSGGAPYGSARLPAADGERAPPADEDTQRAPDSTRSATARALDLIPFDARRSLRPRPVVPDGVAETAPLTDGSGAPSMEFAAIVERLVAFADDRAPAPALPARGDPPTPAGPGADPDDHVAVHPPGAERSGGQRPACAPADSLDVAGWAEAEQREASARGLARSFIAEGRGREAERVLAQAGDADPLLLDLAALVDARMPEKGAFRGMVACPGRAALWAALAGDGRGGALQNGAVIVAAYEELGADLQRQLGPRLVAALAGMGDLGAARIVQRALDRTGGVDDGQAASAELAIELAGAGRPTALPEELVRDRAVALEAITDIADDLAQSDDPVPPDIAEMARSLRLEQRGTPNYGDLVALSLRARMEAGDWAGALAEARAEARRPYAGPVVDETWRAIAADAPDATFVALSLADLPVAEYRGLRTSVRETIDARLAELGARPPGGASDAVDGDGDRTAAPTTDADITPLIDRSGAAIEASRALRDRLGPLLDTDGGSDADAPF